MREYAQGDVWWGETESARRPLLIVTRSEAASRLGRLIVAPVTRTIRRIPTELSLGLEDGLTVECVASFDNLTPVPKSALTQWAGRLAPGRRHEMCAALAALADC